MMDNQNATSMQSRAVSSVQAMTDGERLKRLLTEHGKEPKDLEESTGKSRQMIDKYLKVEKMKPGMRRTVCEGLKHLGIDPELFAHPTSEPSLLSDPAELRSMLNGIPNAALHNLRRMLLEDQKTRNAIVALIDDRLERLP